MPGERELRATSGAVLGSIETGVVKWFNDEKGYGFITRDNNNGDVFVHYKAIKELLTQGSRRTLAEGNRVKFRVEKGPKGFQAEDVEVIRE